MKRKVLLTVLAVLLAVTVACIGVMAANSMSFRLGRCIKAENGSCLLLMDNSPVVLSNHTPLDRPFDRYKTGDVLLVLHDGIQETYPGSTGAYFTLRLLKGNSEDVSQAVRNALTDLGWVIEQ